MLARMAGLLSRSVSLLLSRLQAQPAGQIQQAATRRRHNDLVRRLEFEQLRKIRTAGAAAARHGGAAGASGGAQTDRSGTLQKINAIERQMAGQWPPTAPLEQESNNH